MPTIGLPILFPVKEAGKLVRGNWRSALLIECSDHIHGGTSRPNDGLAQVALRGVLNADVGHSRLKALEAEAARQGKSIQRLALEKFAELGFLAWLDSLPPWGATPHDFQFAGDDEG